MKSKQMLWCIAVVTAMLFLACIITACSVQINLDSNEKDSQDNASSLSENAVEKIDAQEDGFVTKDGVRFYYANGELQVDTIVGNDTDGYFYADKSGAINTGCCNGITIGDTDWIVIEGEAYRVRTESDKCLFAAAKDIAACTTVDMSREEKLKASFDYIKSHYLEGTPHNPPYPYTSMDWPIVCANDLFVNGKGDCYSYGAAFAYYARAIGYTEVYACNSGGHGWAEIENRTYDPEWSLHSSKYTYYGMSYDDECDVLYAKSIADEEDYKRLMIEIHSEFTAS